MSSRPTDRARPRARALALIAALFVALIAQTALAQQPNIVIRTFDVGEDGSTTISISLPPGVDPEAVGTNLTLQENARSIEDFELSSVMLDGGDVLAETVLLMDTSGSTAGDAPDSPLVAAKAAAKDFVTALTQQGIPVTLIAFADAPTLLVSASTDTASLTAAIDGLEAAGDTAMYDAVVLGAQRLSLNQATRQRSIVIFTDGQHDPPDDAPVVSLTDAITAASAANAVVTAVSLATDETTDLRTLATGTNGSVLQVAQTSGLQAALGDVATSITSQVLITWFSDNVLDPQLTVTVTTSIDGQVVTASRTARNVRLAVGQQPPPPSYRSSSPVLLRGLGAKVLALASTAFATVLLGIALFSAPGSTRSAKILRKQLDGRERKSRRSVDDEKFKERVASIMDAVPKPSGFDEALQKQLDQASWPLRSGEFLALSLALGVGGFILGSVGLPGLIKNGSPVLAFVFAGFGAFVPRIILIQRRQKRAQLFHEQLPDTLQMLAGSLRAGYGLMQGLENVSSQGSPPSATEFGRVLTETRIGIPLEDALSTMADRVDSDDFRWVTVAVSIQRKVGGNLAELLDTVATTLRDRDQVRRQVQVLSAEGRLSAVILVALPIAFALYLAAARPEYLAPLVTETPGRIMLGAAGVLMALGIVWIRKVIRIDV